MLLILLGGAADASAQQQADTTFRPVVAHPAFAPEAGPVVLVDEALLRIQQLGEVHNLHSHWSSTVPHLKHLTRAAASQTWAVQQFVLLDGVKVLHSRTG